jgi:WhiB family transcriptional regulator, redox-sensing transcriptional regulator
MFDPQDWHEDAECAKPKNSEFIDNFFANKPAQQYQAKKLCGACPVRKECTQWALNEKQLWGIWGGLDYKEIRRTLSVNWEGQEMRHKRFPLCPYCKAKTKHLESSTIDRPDGGRWSTMRIVTCNNCNFKWQSRTSANAVDAYFALEAKKQQQRDSSQD